MDALERLAFQEVVSTMVLQRTIQYTAAHSLSVRWIEDDTAAASDMATFQAILRTLQLPAAKELVIHETAGWTVGAEVQKILLAAASHAPGRSLVILHYAGHGVEAADGTLRFVERLDRSAKGFNAELHFIGPTLEPDIDLNNVDVLIILDCCFAFTAGRAAETNPRIVEIISATDHHSPLAFSPPRNTVTVKLLGEIRRRQRESYSRIEIANVVDSLRAREAAVKRPTHCLKLGAASICLPCAGLSTVDPTDIPPALRVLFSVHLSYDMSEEEQVRFANWIGSLPASVSMTLEGVYPTGSTCLVLACAWGAWAKVSNMRGFKYVADITGPSTIRHREPPAIASPVKQENVPFHGQKTGPSAKPSW
ncbi:hypothetical protein BJX76DRAFT_365573 [Aspergillus varians]